MGPSRSVAWVWSEFSPSNSWSRKHSIEFMLCDSGEPLKTSVPARAAPEGRLGRVEVRDYPFTVAKIGRVTHTAFSANTGRHNQPLMKFRFRMQAATARHAAVRHR